MMTALAIGGAMLVAAGITVIVAVGMGVVPRPRRHAARPTGLWTRLVGNFVRLDRRTVLLAAGGVLLGLVLAWILRWPILFILMPSAILGLPRLLRDPPQTDLRLLEALDRWIHALLAQLSTGMSIQDALRWSARRTPPPLAARLSLLNRRLDERWSLPQALQAMADELDSADADAVLAALMLSAARGGTGASATLSALAETLTDRLRALREIEAERAKPRVVVRQVVVITTVAAAGFGVFSPGFFAPYASPLGQAILLGLLAAYVGSIVAMQRLTIPRRRQRILRPLS